MAPDDLRDFPLPDAWPHQAAPERTDFAIDWTRVRLPPGDRPEPSFGSGPVMIGFDEPEPAAAENEPGRLDTGLMLAETESPIAASTEWRRSWGADLAAAGVVHVVTLLLLLPWPLMPTEIARPIPVQLVLEQRPSPPPKPETKPPAPGRLASTQLGDPTAKPAKAAAASRIDELKSPPAATASPRRARPHPELISALPKPAPLPEPELDLAEPVVKAAAPPRSSPPIRREAAARAVPHPSPESAWGRVPGPAATQDEYLAYANALIRRNQELIPASLLQGRNGTAVISILVLVDGTIARIEIKESSGYPDIDKRAEQMVAAVKRFPPLPQWFQGTSMLLSYHMLFGNRMVLP